jgi:multiple sugar transport system permease protein
MMKIGRRIRLSLLAYLLLVAAIVLFGFPLVWMASYSLRPTGLPPPSRLEFFSPPYAFENYARVNAYVPLAQYFTNSFAVVALAVPLTLITASWAGLAIAQLSPRWRRILIIMSVGLLLVPPPALWVPRFLILTQLQLVDSLLALVVPAVMGTSPFYILLFAIAFMRIPRDIFDYARADGANLLQAWYFVMLPLARPAVIAVAVLSFVSYWSDYVSPLLYLRSPDNSTMPVAIQLLSQAMHSNFPILMAGSVMIVAPVVLVFAFSQRYFLDISRWRWLDGG